jgi:hypothetical protein
MFPLGYAMAHLTFERASIGLRLSVVILASYCRSFQLSPEPKALVSALDVAAPCSAWRQPDQGDPLRRQNARITGAFSLPGIGLGENPLQMEFTISLLIALLALVSVFIEIPFVSNYAFWVLFGAYVLLAGRK